jgi:methylenetetrahydrofolate reductase (NADPH)
MTPPLLDTCQTVDRITDNFSLEVTVRDIEILTDVAPRLRQGTVIAIPFLARENGRSRSAAARRVRELGFEPMLHLSARRLASSAELEDFLAQAIAEAAIDRCLVVAGDASDPAGPFADSAAVIGTGIFERAGIRTVGVSAHPEGHPVMNEAQCWSVLERKCSDISRRGMTPLIVTQFAFDADRILDWLASLRARGLAHPVRIGVPGPASGATLTRFAFRCGVGTSASLLAKQGRSLSKLLETSGPNRFVDRLVGGMGKAHGAVRLHFYPFGGIARTVGWIEHYSGA